jgi:hypothetical protein
VEYIVPVAIGLLPVLGLFSAMTGKIARCRVKGTVQKALIDRVLPGRGSPGLQTSHPCELHFPPPRLIC